MASTINAKTTGVGGIDASGDASGVLALQTGDTTALTIDASQNVGIGRTPTSFKLEIQSGLCCYTTSVQTIFRSHPSDGNGELGTLTAHAQSFITNSIERMRIDASGNVGIGTSSPSYRLEVKGASATAGQLSIHDGTGDTTVSGATAGSLLFQARDSSIRTIAEIDAVNTTTNGTGGAMVFQTRISDALAERMRIDSSGNLLVGTTTNNSRTPRLALNGNSVTWSVGPSASNSTFVVFNASEVGVYMGSGSSAWSSNSDERLKTDLIPIENGLDKVNSLRSVTGRYKTDEEGVSRSFLIAQDVQAVLPEAVSVQDDELGTLGVAYTEVIPLLVASIKELKTIIDTQNARIEALEAK
jgi:hypothetical protein